MANGTDFDGSNAKYAPPPDVSEDQCKTLYVFKNGACIVSCWELDDAELADVIRTRRVFSSIWSGQTLYPQFIGSEKTVHALVADFGKVWRLSQQSKDRIPLELAAREVLNRFRELESSGAHTKDREYAITLLGKALD